MGNSNRIIISWWDKQIPKLFYCGALKALTISTRALQTEQGSHGQAVWRISLKKYHLGSTCQNNKPVPDSYSEEVKLTSMLMTT